MRPKSVVFSVTLLAGCSVGPCISSPPVPRDAGCNPAPDVADIICQSTADCGACNDLTWACTPNHQCVQICVSAADCAAGQVCEDATCRAPICVDDTACSSGQQCIGGTCSPSVAASSVASCAVLPAAAVMNASAKKTFHVVTLDSTGQATPYKGTVTWGVAGFGGTTDGQSTITETVTAGSTAGTGTVTASIGGSLTCAPASVDEYAAATAGDLRVVAVTLGDATPVAGATVVLNGTVLTTLTGADGSVQVTNPNPTGKNTVSVYAAGFTYVTVVDTAATDILVPLKAAPAPVVFSGNLTAADFANLSDPLGTVHVVISGPSIPGNLIDLSFTTLLGPSAPTMINLGGTTQTNVNLPDGIVVGLGSNMFKSSYSVSETPGYRALWSLGGNIQLTDVLGAVSDVTGGNVDIGAILSTVLPLIGKLQSGVTSGVDVTSTLTAAQTTLTNNPAGPQPSLTLDTLLRVHLTANMPLLPSFEQDDGTMSTFDGAVVIGGALASQQGLVPLGLSAGTAPAGSTTIANPDTGGAAGQLPLRIAPLHGGLETAPYTLLAIGAKLSNLLGGITGGSTTTTNSSLVLSAKVLFPAPGSIEYDDGNPTTVNFGTSFLAVPNGMTITGRALNIPNDISGAAFHRLDIGSGAAQWTIYFPPGESAINVPTPPAPFADRFAGTDPTPPPETVVQSVSLGYGDGLTYDDVVTFGSTTVDDLSLVTDQFSTRQVPRP